MERTLNRLSEAIFSVSKWLLIFLMIEITCVIGVNIIGRYAFSASLYWAEEVTRYSFVWATFIGAACAYRQRGLVSMSVFVHMMPERLKYHVGLLLDAVMGVFLFISLAYGVKLTMAVQAQRSASLEISMSIVYICIPLTCLFMLIFNLAQIVTVIKHRKPLAVWGENWS